LLSTLAESGSKVNSLTIHRNQLAIGLLDKVILFDLNTNTIVAELESPGDHAFMSFNADASIFAVGNSTGQIYIWKLRGNQYQLENTIPTEEIFAMTFNPQGDKLFIGNLNNLIILDPNTGTEISRILHKDAITSISFSTDGNTLATASLKAVQFWNVQNIQLIPSDILESTACTRLTQNFDAAQWESFFGEEPYRKLCESLP
jgi:WD40 repeat protein